MHTFPDSQSPPSLVDARHLLASLAELIPPESPPYDDLFTVELAFRSLLPVLEHALQPRIQAGGDFDGAQAVDEALTQLARHLLWLELHGLAPLEEVSATLRMCLGNAEQAVHYLA